jgi:hypothetical protein
VIRLPAAIYFCAVAALAFPLRDQKISAQTLSIAGTVTGSNGIPLPFGTASLRETGTERFSNERGEFVLANLAPGTYHLRVKQLGFVAFDTAIVLVAGRPPSRLEIVLSPIAFKLATVTVKGSQACLAPDSVANSDFQTIIAELRKNADRERLLVTSYPFEYRLEKKFEKLSAGGVPQFGRTETLAYRSDQRPRYSQGKVLRTDSTIQSPDNLIMMIPVLEDLGDPEFLRSHCFKYLGTKSDRDGTTHRIDFKPLQSVRTPDIEGSVFLDSRSYVIRRAIFRLTEGRQLNPPVEELEVTTHFREVFPGVTIIDNVESVQRATPESYAVQSVRLTERQKLVDVRFLQGQPGDTLRKR